MTRPKRWNLAPPHPDAPALAARLKTSEVIAQVLLNRGLNDALACQDFLRPSLKCLHDPAGIPGLTRAAERVAQAIKSGEEIVIYGDYDVDGITATSILWHAIRRLGGACDFYIPHRIDEGYGLNAEAIATIVRDGAKLIITVDCGVTAVAPAKVARDADVDLIITDHHEWHVQAPPLTEAGSSEPILPRCYAIVHPRLPQEDPSRPAYPNPHLCGAGVAFKLAWGIGQAVNGAARVSDDFREFLVEATALAALGTIADVVPLTGENRVLAAFGLGGLTASKLVGIRALIESAGLTGKELDSYHVGFLLAPRLNACGRMGHARLAVEMLTRADSAKASEIATYLEGENKRRQAVERKIVEGALEQVRELKLDADCCRAVVLGAKDWHAGVIGIVASRLVERLHRPTIMVAFNPETGIGQGSGRSIAGFHLAHALESCAEHLEAYGGHEMAAGLKVLPEQFEPFREAFARYAGGALSAEQLTPELRLDAEAPLRSLTQSFVTDLHRLGPFGHANRKPLFCARDLTVAAPPRRVGKSGDHLQLQVRQGQTTMKAIAFGAGNLADDLSLGSTLDLAFEPTLNEWNGRVSVELAVKDVRMPGDGAAPKG